MRILIYIILFFVFPIYSMDYNKSNLIGQHIKDEKQSMEIIRDVYGAHFAKEFMNKYNIHYNDALKITKKPTDDTKYIALRSPIILENFEDFREFVLLASSRNATGALTYMEIFIANLLRPRPRKTGKWTFVRNFLDIDENYSDVPDQEVIQRWEEIRSAWPKQTKKIDKED